MISSPQKRTNPKLFKLLIITIGVAPILAAIGFLAFISQPKKLATKPLTSDEYWAVNQVNNDYLNSQQQANLFVWGNDVNEVGQWQRLISNEAQRLITATDGFRRNKKHPCYRMSRDGCLNTIEENIEKQWNTAAIRLDYAAMASAIFKFEAVQQARSGEVTALDFRPNLMVSMMRKLRSDRNQFLSQTAESEAQNQLTEEQEALREYQKEGDEWP